MTSIPPMQFIDWWIAKTDEQRLAFLANEQTSETVKRNLMALESYCRRYAYKVYCSSQLRPRVLPVALDSFGINTNNKEEEEMKTLKEEFKEYIEKEATEKECIEERSLLHSPLLLSLYTNTTSNSKENKFKQEEIVQEEQQETEERSYCVGETLPSESKLLGHREEVTARLERFLHDTLIPTFHTEKQNIKDDGHDESTTQQLIKLFAQVVIMLLSEATVAAVYRTGLVDKLYREYKELAIAQSERENAKRQSRTLRLSYAQKLEEEEEELQQQQVETSLIRNEEVHDEFTLRKPIEAYCKEMKALCGLQELLHPIMSLLSLSEFTTQSESFASTTDKRKRARDLAYNNTSENCKFEVQSMSSWTRLRLTCVNAYNAYLQTSTRENEESSSCEQKTNVNKGEINAEVLQSTVKEQLTLTERDVRFAIQHLMRSKLFLDLTATIATLL